MRELSLIMLCDGRSRSVYSYAEYINAVFSEVDHEIIIINAAEDEQISEELMRIEREAPDKVALINCPPELNDDEALEIGLEYAQGVSFILIHAGDELVPELFDSLLYDEALINENRFRFLHTKFCYILQSAGKEGFEYLKKNDRECLEDRDSDAGNIDLHYFYQDIYVAGRIFRAGIKHIYDIGSRIDGFISHLLSMGIKVTMVDIRPLGYVVEGLDFVQGNATELAGIPDDSVSCLSSLHALEHFGLGRYGDPVDYDGWKKALYQYKRVLKKDGYLYLSVPVGNTERVEFNAHRIFDPLTIIREVGTGLNIEEFTFFRNGKRTTYDLSRASETEEVLEYTRDNMMGPYDCGIFIFRKV